MTTTVAVLGTGIMGAGMAGNLANADLDVRVWNRNRDRAEPLADAGAAVADSAAEAVAGADVVLTMLFDEAAVSEVMAEALPAMTRGAVWVQSGTLGVEATGRLAERAAATGIEFVDAPVMGTKQPAEEGKLIILAAGPDRVRSALEPVFEAIAARTIWVGERPGDGHRLKLVANAWVVSLVAAAAQSIDLAARLGLDPQLFLDTIAGGASDSPYAQAKGRAMIGGNLAASFPLEGAAKDTQLILEAMGQAGARQDFLQAVSALYADALAAGHGGDDLAAVVAAFRRDHEPGGR
ncbi:MAG: NAD(P)-dependent oxidoreductase [Pseudarthrobacter sp.]|nr:NAD(P)-dependent oxidoreductase [Pseudarthrobacter sp.]